MILSIFKKSIEEGKKNAFVAIFGFLPSEAEYLRGSGIIISQAVCAKLPPHSVIPTPAHAGKHEEDLAPLMLRKRMAFESPLSRLDQESVQTTRDRAGAGGAAASSHHHILGVKIFFSSQPRTAGNNNWLTARPRLRMRRCAHVLRGGGGMATQAGLLRVLPPVTIVLVLMFCKQVSGAL